MKFLHLFNTTEERDNAYVFSNSSYVEPWVSAVTGKNVADFNIEPSLSIIRDDGTAFNSYGLDSLVNEDVVIPGQNYKAQQWGFKDRDEFFDFVNFCKTLTETDGFDKTFNGVINVGEWFEKYAPDEREASSPSRGIEEVEINFSSYSGYNNMTFDKIIVGEGVTQIGSNAFGNEFKTATHLFLPSTIGVIGDIAFNNQSGLKYVFIKSETPPELGVDTFNARTSLTIAVPEGSEENYRIAQGWSSYADNIFGVL